MTIASSSAPIPADRPIPTAQRMKRASPELFSELRKRTAAAMPAIEKASASEFWTMMMMLVTTIGMMMIVSTSDWS